MNILFFGNGLAAVLCLGNLIKKKYLSKLLVITPPGGKLHDWHVSLADYCRKNKIKYIAPKNVNSRSTLNKFNAFKPDVVFSVYYTQILSEEILKSAKHAINFHPSLLPKYRGTSPLIWAIVSGEKKTGITAHEMNSEVDSGKIYSQEEIKIDTSDTGYNLHKKAAKKCVEVFESVLSDLCNNSLSYFYPKGKGSYYSSRTPRINKLDPSRQSRMEIYNIIRALAKPLPRSYLYKDNNKKYFINKASFDIDKKLVEKLRKEYAGSSKQLFEFEGDRYIKARDGFLKIEEHGLEK